MSCSKPAKLAKLSCPINDLADEDLAAIFQRLPPYERLIVSEVCRRWRDISRKSWFDVKTLDVSPIPGKHVGAAIKQCTSLQHVFAVKKWFGLNELAGLSKIPSLSRARFYDCHFEVDAFAPEAFSAIFSDNLRNASLSELVMHDATFVAHIDEADCFERGSDVDDDSESEENDPLDFSADALPASLTRLQLSGLRCFNRSGLRPHSILHLRRNSFLDGLERLENLVCLILHDGHYPRQLVGRALDESEVFEQICRLKNLKELCLGPIKPIFEGFKPNRRLGDLPNLAVLFLRDIDADDVAGHLMKFLGTNSRLRTLVFSGSFEVKLLRPVTLCSRKRLDGEENLPPLHIFVGKEAEENIRFVNKPTSNPAIISHRVDVPMPEFLEREDITPLFEGVWVAEKIKETAKAGGKLWNYGADFSDVSSDF